MAYFSRRIQLQRFFKDLPYESAEFGEEAPTMAEAIKLVEQDIHNYVEEKKAQLKKIVDNEEIPFENKPRPVRMLKNEPETTAYGQNLNEIKKFNE